MFLKIFFILFLLSYQNIAYSKTTEKNEFNQKYLSNYFLALITSGNDENEEALKFFNSSKFLIQKHDNFLKEYTFSLVLNGKVKKAINQIKTSKTSRNSNFFEAELLYVLDSFKRKDFKQASSRLKKLEKFQDNGTYEFIIYKTLESYNYLFLNKKIKRLDESFGKLGLINNAFQNCYLNSEKTEDSFLKLINSVESDYSRYLFFYLENLIRNKDLNKAKRISSSIDLLSSTLLVAQAKTWIDQNKFEEMKKYFSCKNENDILGEFFFLISNLSSSQENFKYSNFYSNISNFLNPKFYFNLTLNVENFYDNNDFRSVKKTLDEFDNRDEIFNWFKTKKMAQILIKEKNDELALKYIEKKFTEIKNPSIRVLYDLANIYKNFKQYEKAIGYYSTILSTTNIHLNISADILYKRGSCYERLKKYKLADKDLLKSLKISSDEPYTLNYLAYSWLERDYKIDEAFRMLEKAYKQTKNDPFITDSLGWAHYKVGNYIIAEEYLKKAVELMPDDPVISDHYGDVLWRLDRRLQAKYFWENVLDLEETDEKIKIDIKNKLLYGLEQL